MVKVSYCASYTLSYTMLSIKAPRPANEQNILGSSMKITALMPEDLIENVQELTGGKTVTESLITALREWVSQKKLAALGIRLKKHPLSFKSENIAAQIRKSNRLPT